MTANVAQAETNGFIEKWLVLAVWVYCYVYALEGVVRFALNTVGLDSLIFADNHRSCFTRLWCVAVAGALAVTTL